MHNNNSQFRITADGNVYRGRFEPYDKLGHIGSILHPTNRSHTATQVRAWWSASLNSEEPIAEYVPPAQSKSTPIIRVRPSALVVGSAFTDDAAGDVVESVAAD